MNTNLSTHPSAWLGLCLALVLGLATGRYLWAVAYAYARLWMADAATCTRDASHADHAAIPDAHLLWRALSVGLRTLHPRPAGDTTAAWIIWLPAAVLAFCSVFAISCTPNTPSALALAWAASVLLLLALIDAQTHVLPDALTYPLLWTGLALSLFGVTTVALTDAVAAVMLAYGALWLSAWAFRWLRGKDGMGGGDIKLLAAIGAWVGWPDVFWVLLWASLAGIAVALMRTCWQPVQGQAWDDPAAFGPYLAGAALAVLWLRTLAEP